MFVYTDYFSETFTRWACTDRGVERKHLVCRLLELYAVSFEFCTETVKPAFAVGHIETQHTCAVAFIHGCFGRVRQSAYRILVVITAHAVNQKIYLVAFVIFVIFYPYYFAVNFQTRKALFQIHVQLFLMCASVARQEQSQYCIFRSFGVGKHTVHYIFRAVFFHKLTAYRRVCFSDSGKQQSQVFVYFGRCSYCGAWVSAYNLLFDGYSRRNTFDEVAFRFSHSSKELPCV